MKDIAISVEGLSKAYQLGQIGSGTLSRDLERWYARIRGKEDPLLIIGENNDQNTKSHSNVVWSLKDISFEVKKGDAVGIIGKNGAGKSTLLKILSKVTTPTTGRISGNGRIASLLEVGTGFHPELSGRENIFLNGAILGMRKREIQRKLEEIVDFAGIERYLDTPVKRYSSGMYVRLAFAVAAHLESEILIVDEVLAVGDADFQKKCLGKMSEVSKGEGRTVLFVSHNMTAIKKLCSSSILLNKGNIEMSDLTHRVIEHYYHSNKERLAKVSLSSKREGSGVVQFYDFDILNNYCEPKSVMLSGETIVLKFILNAKSDIQNIDIGFSIHDEDENMLSVIYSSYQDKIFNLKKGLNEVFFELADNYLSNRTYFIRGLLKADNIIADMPLEPLGELVIESGNFYQTGSIGHQTSKVAFLIKGKWS
ncbi:hypothetical protein ASE74_12275 [Pedobacter sp. Leaf216]|uniref:ABC transporter ATP-binding protein n=1 Tax=Pedobacter sp. Leaf216 TaxID=1735684 RepID=UPI0007021FF2|nr:polysaccharide ABC transporter ATP-binding protein [Pedobacter sp. Leaf216]KQM63939.1 hypothetical protein ASE74_12275 [Pedobacter sp. Leaf216]